MATTTSTTNVQTTSGKVRAHGSAVITANAASILSATVIAPDENAIKQAGATVAARVNDNADIEVHVQGPVGCGTVAVVVQSVDA